MNVKPGDVAIITKGRTSNIGRIVYVARHAGDHDYSLIGYGVLPCWFVESLGGDLDSSNGPVQKGFTPDISLWRLDLSPKQAQAMRVTKAEHAARVALAELAELVKTDELSRH